jgi:hypothetical protein
LIVFAFCVATPYAFLLVGRIRPSDWAKFSNEGQAYGGLAAVIGMLAIAGVVASLMLQVRESAANRVQAERTFHADLVYKALEEPELIECWGRDPMPGKDLASLRRHCFVNLIISHYYAMFEIGRWSDETVHRLAADIFTGMPARDHWAITREEWTGYPSGSLINRKFVAIMDEEYRRAIASGPVTVRPKRRASAPKASGERSMISGLAVGAVCGAFIAAATAAILSHSRLP